MVIYTPTWTAQFTWAALLALFVTFIFAYGIGANDCSNAWGTAIGSGTIKHWQAYLLAALFNTLGAILLGTFLPETFSAGIATFP
jgi:phosphate/sulfate permease